MLAVSQKHGELSCGHTDWSQAFFKSATHHKRKGVRNYCFYFRLQMTIFFDAGVYQTPNLVFVMCILHFLLVARENFINIWNTHSTGNSFRHEHLVSKKNRLTYPTRSKIRNGKRIYPVNEVTTPSRHEHLISKKNRLTYPTRMSSQLILNL